MLVGNTHVSGKLDLCNPGTQPDMMIIVKAMLINIGDALTASVTIALST